MIAAIRALLVLVVAIAAIPGLARAQGVGQFVSPGPLAEAHRELEGLANCARCHAIGQGIAAGKCLGCHEAVKVQVETGRGFHAGKGTSCQGCHPDHRGRDFALIRIETSTFDHDQTGFPLRGAHARATCEGCHGDDGDFGGQDPACASCHESPHGVQQSSRKLLQGCDTCHQTLSWDALPLPTTIFDHDDPKQASYPLELAHEDVACRACHAELRFVPVPHDGCVDCHGDPHHTDFGAACEACHPAPSSWAVDAFDHRRTGFPLVGQHGGVACEQCHGDDVTKPLAHGACASCHRDPHAGQFAPRGCDACHTVEHAGFAIPSFDHAATGWPLEGEHQFVTCASCHGDGPTARYANVGRDCDSCHEDAHDGQYEPVACARCHSPIGFRSPHFDHADTNFPHTGKHVGLACDLCHTSTRWTELSYASCNDCHFRENPHRSAFAGDRCDDCHVTTGFADVAFDHVGGTGFDLAPAHVGLGCGGCHEDLGGFVGNDPACTSCHAMPPGHYAGACGDCHAAAHWVPGGLGGRDHAITGFDLHGAHQEAPCGSCHADGQPFGVAHSGCDGCHADEDPHAGMLGNTCGDCHSSFAWYGARFRHATTGWPLRGSHRLAECVDCHAAGYVGTPTQCWRCHEADASPLIPAHQSAYLPVCDACHKPYTWAVPNFPH